MKIIHNFMSNFLITFGLLRTLPYRKASEGTQALPKNFSHLLVRVQFDQYRIHHFVCVLISICTCNSYIRIARFPYTRSAKLWSTDFCYHSICAICCLAIKMFVSDSVTSATGGCVVLLKSETLQKLDATNVCTWLFPVWRCAYRSDEKLIKIFSWKVLNEEIFTWSNNTKNLSTQLFLSGFTHSLVYFTICFDPRWTIFRWICVRILLADRTVWISKSMEW
jgi:hypothetical protein